MSKDVKKIIKQNHTTAMLKSGETGGVRCSGWGEEEQMGKQEVLVSAKGLC